MPTKSPAQAAERMIDRVFVHKIFEGFSIQRWNDLIRPFDIVEMDKAGEKMVIAYIIGKFEENRGVFVDWNWIVYASLFDLLKKIALCDIKATVQQILKTDYRDEYLKLTDWVLKQYEPIIDDNELFSQFKIYLGQKAGAVPIPEQSVSASRILSAAHKYATMRELQMLTVVNEPERLENINTEILSVLQTYLDLPGLQMLMTRQRSFDFIMKIEQLRFQTRWNQTPRIPKTSVLGHCFFVAVMTLLLCRRNPVPMCRRRIVNNFFCALFHDLPEAVTRDIISPVKQATDGLPKIVKRIEDDVVQRELVPLMEPFFIDDVMYFIREEFSNRVIIDGKTVEVSWTELNEKYNEDHFSPIDGRLVRISDHLSALMEADISIKHGITSPHLELGRDGILNAYPEDSVVNGLSVGKFFRRLV